MVNVRFNHFNAIAMVDSKGSVTTFIKLEESGVSSVVDEIGDEVDKKCFLNLSAWHVDNKHWALDITTVYSRKRFIMTFCSYQIILYGIVSCLQFVVLMIKFYEILEA